MPTNGSYVLDYLYVIAANCKTIFVDIHADLYYTCHCSDLLLYAVIPVTIFLHL